MRRVLTLSLILIAAMATVAGAKVNVGLLFHDGEIVRTIVPPAAMPKPGTDNLYVIDSGVTTQLPVAAVAPGDRDYHGGKWAFHLVTWDVDPYLLTSESQVLAAEAAGDVTITRVPENDFKCPIQGSKGGDVFPE
ncbi:MAG: hypothetical protein ACYTGN_04910 [Planctomycetota bacterium]|jgi:hypothetical protein